MSRPIWKGHITFGLVSIPVTLFTAIDETSKAPAFHLIDKRNHKRVKNLRVNEETGEEVPWEEVEKGYEYEKDKYVILSDADFESAALESNQVINIDEFVSKSDINPLLYQKPYYLINEKKDQKGYVILREILKKTDKAGIAKVVISKREYLAAVLPMGDALVLELLLFNAELKKTSAFEFPSGALEKFKISDAEINIAEKLIQMMSANWEPEKYQDEYTERLNQLIDKKIHQPDKVVQAGQKRVFAEYTDFMEILNKSIEQKMAAKKGHKKTA